MCSICRHPQSCGLSTLPGLCGTWQSPVPQYASSPDPCSLGRNGEGEEGDGRGWGACFSPAGPGGSGCLCREPVPPSGLPSWPGSPFALLPLTSAGSQVVPGQCCWTRPIEGQRSHSDETSDLQADLLPRRSCGARRGGSSGQDRVARPLRWALAPWVLRLQPDVVG